MGALLDRDVGVIAAMRMATVVACNPRSPPPYNRCEVNLSRSGRRPRFGLFEERLCGRQSVDLTVHRGLDGPGHE